MEVVESIFNVAKVIYDRCEVAESNKKRCNRLKMRVELLLSPVNMLKNEPEKSKELEKTLSELLINLQNASLWVEKFSGSGWWRRIIHAGGIQDKFMHISEQLGDTAHNLQVLVQVEHRQKFLSFFDDERLKKQNLKDILEDLSEIKLKIERDAASLHDKVDSVNEKIQKLLQAEIFQRWDIKEIAATDLKCGNLLETPGMTKNTNYSLHRGEYHKSPVVIKVLRGELNTNDDFIKATFKTDSKIMKRYECPNILRLYGRDPRYSIVMEYCEKGTLRELLRQEPDLSWERRVQLSLDAARALYRLHQTEWTNILHGSLSSCKFLVDGTYCLKLSGFELSKTESSMRRNPVESKAESRELVYVAPEVWQTINSYDKRSEIYSLGAVILEIAVGGFSLQDFPAMAPEDMHPRLCAMIAGDLPTSCPPVLHDIITRCLTKEKESRPSAGEIADLLIAHS
ncbi:mixed lineage kinase domain-like protein isoform X2 [Rhinoderma darwinii]|uniref:mixed lineage kinase domain-like protein isoform X2 n=1 Tax=Rhinoderma darwinii TaxID=43563 RepID=UPI003F663103